MARTRKQNTQADFNNLKASIKRGDIERVYVLTGEETFLIENIVESLTAELIEPGAVNLDRLVCYGQGRGGKVSLEQIMTEVRTPPFLSKRKLVIVRESNWLSAGQSARKTGKAAASDEDADDTDNPTEPINRTDALIDLFDRVPDSASLVMIENKVDRRLKKLIQAVERNGVLISLERATPNVLQQWIEAQCRRHSITIDRDTAESLIDRCEESMQIIEQELTKIFLFCEATKCRHLTREIIDAVSLPDLHGSIFDLTDALSSGRIVEALRLTDTLISQKQPIQLILFMLSRHFRQLICAAELNKRDALVSALRIPPFVADRLIRQAGRINIDHLERLYASCFETDVSIKSGRISDRLALETLLVESAEMIRQGSGNR
ncbi:MAG: DNA polymerase III subunit delta [Eubacteriales bacterium]|nr:DNA polymerase III subunit delta [Eubacteriales bacterium]